MATVHAVRVPFHIHSTDGEISGYAVGESLEAYSVFEVRLKTGEIFNIEAIPSAKGFFWFSFEAPSITPIIGRSIETWFKN